MKRIRSKAFRWMKAVTVVVLLGNDSGHGDEPWVPGGRDPASRAQLEEFFMQDYLLGTWGGRRPALSKRGVDFEFFYFGSVPGNLSGGIREGAVYQGALLLDLALDSGKLGLWPDGRLHASAVWTDGKPFAEDYVGDLNRSNLVDFPADLRLWELSYEQGFMKDRFRFKVGLLSVDRDFLVPELYGTIGTLCLLNQTFLYPTLAFMINDMPGLPPGNHALAATPYSAPGAIFRWNVTDAVRLQAGVYDGNPAFDGSGTKVALRQEEGALLYFEAAYRRRAGTPGGRLPTSVKLGGYYHTDEFADIQDAVGANFGFGTGGRIHRGNYGAYLLVEQMLYREPGSDDELIEGLTGFLRAAGAPSDRNIADFGMDGGLIFQGLIPGREYDSLAIAGSYLRMSGDLRAAQRLANTVAPGFFVENDFEAVVELSYKAQLAAWWTIQPSIQYAIHPGGSRAVADAWVGILQTTIRF